MATETLDDLGTKEEFADDGEQPKRRFRLSNKKVKTMLLVLLVMGIEATGFYTLVPKAAKPGAAGEDAPGELASVETVEVAFDTFQVFNGSAVPGRRLYVEFKLTAVVAQSQEVAFDQAASKKHKASVKQAVQEVVSSSNLTELYDPRLSVIRRRMKEEINKVLRKSFVSYVILTDYRVSEQ
jgi:flagellar basal body-associated protein FliL